MAGLLFSVLFVTRANKHRSGSNTGKWWLKAAWRNPSGGSWVPLSSLGSLFTEAWSHLIALCLHVHTLSTLIYELAAAS